MEQEQNPGKQGERTPEKKSAPVRPMGFMVPRALFPPVQDKFKDGASASFEESFMTLDDSDTMNWDTSSDEDGDVEFIKVAAGKAGYIPSTQAEVSSLKEKITSAIEGYHLEFVYNPEKLELHYQSVQDEVSLGGADNALSGEVL